MSTDEYGDVSHRDTWLGQDGGDVPHKDETPDDDDELNSRQEKPPEDDDDADDDDLTKDTVASGAKTATREPWLMLVFIFSVYTLIGIHFFFYPVCYVELVQAFDVPTAQIGWPVALNQALSFYFGVVLTGPIEVYGCRMVAMVGGVVMATGIGLSYFANSIIVLSLTYGLLGGIGLSMVFLATPVILQQNFHKNRPLANGIALCGLNVGNVIGPLWVDHLLATYGWRGGFLIHGGLMLQATVLATQYRPATIGTRSQPPKKLTMANMRKGLLDFSFFKNPSFVLLGVGVFLLRFAQYGSFTVFVSMAHFYGMSMGQATVAMTVTGIVVLLSRLGSGFLANMACVNRTVFLGTATMIGGLGLLVIVFYHTYAAILLGGCVFGLSVGGSVMLVFVSLVDVVGIANIARSMALVFVFQGTGALVAPPVAGGLFDLTGDYSATYWCVAIGSILGGVLIFVAAFLEKLKKNRQKKGEKFSPDVNNLGATKGNGMTEDVV